jgi:hypothetical protein
VAVRAGVVGGLFPLLDAAVMYVLATSDAVCDVLCGWIEVFLADAAFLAFGVGREDFAVLLELRLEQGGGAADEVFVDGETAVDVVDFEADDFAADALHSSVKE